MFERDQGGHDFSQRGDWNRCIGFEAAQLEAGSIVPEKIAARAKGEGVHRDIIAPSSVIFIANLQKLENFSHFFSTILQSCAEALLLVHI